MRCLGITILAPSWSRITLAPLFDLKYSTRAERLFPLIEYGCFRGSLCQNPSKETSHRGKYVQCIALLMSHPPEYVSGLKLAIRTDFCLDRLILNHPDF